MHIYILVLRQKQSQVPWESRQEHLFKQQVQRGGRMAPMWGMEHQAKAGTGNAAGPKHWLTSAEWHRYVATHPAQAGLRQGLRQEPVSAVKTARPRLSSPAFG